MRHMRYYLTLSAFAVALLAAGSANAGSGDHREQIRYQKIINRYKLNLRCSSGTKLIVQGSARGTEEMCTDREGVRHGYYLRWQQDGETWAAVGEYKYGNKVGRWVFFDKSGRVRSVVNHNRRRRRNNS